MRQNKILTLVVAFDILGNGHAHTNADSLPVPKALYEGRFLLGDYRVNQTLLDGQKGLLIGAAAGFALSLPMTIAGISRNEDLAGLPSIIGALLGGGLGGVIGLGYGFTHGVRLEDEDNPDPDFRARYRRFGFEWRGPAGIPWDVQEEIAMLLTLRHWRKQSAFVDELKFGLGASAWYVENPVFRGGYFDLLGYEFFLSGQKNLWKARPLSPFAFLDAGLIWGRGSEGYGNEFRHRNAAGPLLRPGFGLKLNAWDLMQGHFMITYNVVPAMTYFHAVRFEEQVAVSVGLSSYCF